MRFRFWLIAACAVLFIGCGGKKTPAGEQRTFTIGICVARETDATREMHRAIDENAPKEDASVIWASADQNEAEQDRIFEKFYHEGVKGIVFEPVNPLTAGYLVDGAIRHGIPIAGFGEIPQSGQMGIFIMPDLKNAAEELVRQTSGHVHSPGRILVLASQFPDSLEMRLVDETIRQLRDYGSAYQAFKIPDDSVSARRSISSILFTPKPPAAVIATRALYAIIASDLIRLSLITPRPVLTCFSSLQSAKEGLRNGSIDAVVDPQPGEMGRAALSGIMHLIKRLPLDTHEDIIRVGDLLVPVLKTPVRTLTPQSASR